MEQKESRKRFAAYYDVSDTRLHDDLEGGGLLDAAWCYVRDFNLDEEMERASLQPGDTVIDLGCGSGWSVQSLIFWYQGSVSYNPNYTQVSIIGIDPNTHFTQPVIPSSEVHVIEGGAESLPETLQAHNIPSPRLVISRNVFEEIYKLGLQEHAEELLPIALKGIYDALSSGGIFLLYDDSLGHETYDIYRQIVADLGLKFIIEEIERNPEKTDPYEAAGAHPTYLRFEKAA